MKVGDKVSYTICINNEPFSLNTTKRVIGKIVWIESFDNKLPYQKVKVDSTITTMKDIELILEVEK
ncbi:hypothetical protein LCGC14_2865030 [marine sediment metagenome]|uniref:Uncharacterized protein n=1 Tax=marine sediment metagenome TaxID=412755 RepID=A0A0F8Y4F5_9ZZZZ